MYINSNPDDEYVMVFQPVFVRRRDIHSLPPMTSIQQTPPRIPIELLAPDPIEQPEQPKTLSKPANASGSPHTPQKPLKGLASWKQMEWVRNIANQFDMTEADICKKTGAKSLEQMTKAQASKFIQEYI